MFQGTILSHCSSPSTIDRNTGIFYIAFTSSGVIGNIFSFYQFREDSHIDKETRFVFVSVLAVIAILGTITFLFLLPMPWAEEEQRRQEEQGMNKRGTALEGFKKAASMFATQKMLLLVGE